MKNVFDVFSLLRIEEKKFKMTTKDEHKEESSTSDVDAITLNYRIDETPPWYLALLLGFQVN